MIKKVKTSQLKKGMFIHDLNCGWMEHPFLSNKIRIKDEKIIRKILDHGIKDVYIDTEKGLDLPSAPSAEEVKKETQENLEKLVKNEEKKDENISTRQEISEAKNVKKEAKLIVSNIMNDVRLGKQIEVEKVSNTVDKMIDSILRNSNALITLSRLKQKDEYTFQHSVSVSALMITFSKFLNLERSEIKKIGIGALLHDIGKMKIPDKILNKQGKLTDEEFKIIKNHVGYSEKILSQTPGISSVSILAASQHHERYNGSGYLRGLKGNEISKYGHMAAIVDVYDAMTSNRCYHNASEPAEVLRKLFEWSRESIFNRTMTEIFIRCVGIYPVGTLVRLESGFLGIVTEPGVKSALEPVVNAVYDSNKKQFITPYDIDLSKPKAKDRILHEENPESWGIEPQRYL